MIKFILSISVVIILGIYSIPYAIISLFIKDKEKIKNYNHNLIRNVFKIVLFIDGVKIYVNGIENLNRLNNEKSIFIISNHRGYFDILAGYITIGRKCAIVAKDSLKKIPILSYWMKNIDCIFLNRNDLRSGMQMILDSIKLLESGTSVWIFPEGTRNKNVNPTDLLEFKQGLFKIPTKTDSYILPLAILNSENVFEKQFPRVKSANIYINIGKPYKMSDLNEEDKQNIGEYSKNVMKELLNEMKGNE